jgi:hypothetical protein
MVARSGRGALRPALPLGVVARLRATSLASPVDAQTGYQRLTSVLPRGAELDAAALAEDGTLAIALSDTRYRLAVLRAGQVSATLLMGGRATALAFTPEGELYVGFDDGGLWTLAAGAPATALARAERGPAPASSVTGFAFDRATKKTAVLFAGGEVFTALRPFRRGALQAVRIPWDARVRLALFDDDSALVLAGDSGAVFISTGDGWEAASLATRGAVVALATDLAGHLLVAQSDGELFRRDGGWVDLGRATAPPVAIGELGGQGVVAVLSDGRVVGAPDSRGTPAPLAGYVPRGRASTGQIAGMNVLVFSRERVVIAEPGPAALAWVSDDPAVADAGGTLHDCRPVWGEPSADYVVPTSPRLLCNGVFVSLGAAGVRAIPALPVSGRPLPAREVQRLLVADGNAIYVAGQVVRPSGADELPGLLVFRVSELRYVPLVTLPLEEGPLYAWSAAPAEDGALELATVSDNHSVRFARVALDASGAMGAEPVPAQLIASPAAVAVLRDGWVPPLPTALGHGKVLLAYALPTRIGRLDAAAPDRVEPVQILADPHDRYTTDRHWPAVVAAAGGAFLSRPGLLEHIGATGDAVRVASGFTLAFVYGTLAVEESGRLHALAARLLPGDAYTSVVVDCDASRCTEREFPAGLEPSVIVLGDDEHFGVFESDGTVGRFTR